MKPTTMRSSTTEEGLREAAIQAATQARIEDLYYLFKLNADLNDYLHKTCGCSFALHNGRFYLMATRDSDKGTSLGRNLDFADMMEIALKRRIEE